MDFIDNHKRILGILYMVSATLTIFGMLLFNTFISLIFSYAADEADADGRKAIEIVGSVLQYLPIFVIVFFSIPTLIAGFGLLARKSWASLLAVIVGCFKLFSFPIGTAIGVYSIWIYSEEQKVKKSTSAKVGF